MHTLYEMADSGNCYKVRLLLNLLGIPYERRPTDILAGESRTDAFLAQNPNGKVPLLVLPDGRPLAESNAILLYLAHDTPYLPSERYALALVHQWMFFEQYSHEPFIATNRFFLHIEKSGDANAERIEANHPRGLAALSVMEQHLETNDFFVDTYSVADIALYAYTHVAYQGGYDLADFPAIGRWLDRVALADRHISIAD